MISSTANGRNQSSPVSVSECDLNLGIVQSSEDISLEDPAKWPILSNNLISKIVKAGPLQVMEFNFPRTAGRKFNPKFYKRTMQNGQIIDRPWLIYSVSVDAIFCFCCKLLCGGRNRSALSYCGMSNWCHASQSLRDHEKSRDHMRNFTAWKQMEKKLISKNTDQICLQKPLSDEVRHWRDALKRLILCVQFLGVQSLAFRGGSDKLYDDNNGNFLKLVETIATFDPVLQQHLNYIKCNNTRAHYLSHTIHTELIQLISNAVRSKIVKSIQETKYFSIIVDCTSDKSHVEQTTLVVRFVELNRDSGCYEIKEHFIGFLESLNTSGKGLTQLILEEIKKLGLSIKNCRGQGYDIGSNMRGKMCGVQKRILEIEPRAFFVPCGIHSLNLEITDGANCSQDAVSFFICVQSLFVFFSSSTARWEIFKSNVTRFPLKPLSQIRWESRIDAIQPLMDQLHNVHEALVKAAEQGDAVASCTATEIAENITQFKFICILVIWHDILAQSHMSSKYLQRTSVNLPNAEAGLLNFKTYLIKLRCDSQFELFLNRAKHLAEKFDIDPTFPEPYVLRSRRVTQQSKTGVDDLPKMDTKQQFKYDFYFKILDQFINSISERFELTKKHSKLFNFMYDISAIKEESNILNHCKVLEHVLTHKLESDVNSSELAEELKMLSTLLPKNATCLNALNLIQHASLDVLLPNTVIALKIILTMPVTVASRKISCSKLKIIKNYLRTSMTEERLLGSAILSIEKQIVFELDSDELVHEFAKTKARKI